jgi:hypothetical protein
MSKIALAGAASGTATFTIESPATSTNRTLILPDNTGTILTNATAGTVLQVVSATKTDTFSSSSTSFVDITGLSVSITPTATTSKILILSSVYASFDDTGLLQLVRNSTAIGNGSSGFAMFRFGATNQGGSFVINYLDSPSSTSSLTYKIQARRDGGTTFYINRRASDASLVLSSHITVMEIAA